MKRLSYNWFYEVLSTMLTTIFIVSFSVIIFKYFNASESKDLLNQILTTNILATPIITLFFGLQPITNSGKIPKTLYINECGHLYLNKKIRLDINEIEKIIIVRIAAVEMSDHYYKVLFKDLENNSINPIRRPIYLAEKYSFITFFTHFFKTKLDVIDYFKTSGLNSNQIVDGEADSNFLFMRKNK